MKLWLLVCACYLLSACSPYARADKFALAHNMQKQAIKTQPFTLTTFERIQKQNSTISVYVEGDGRAFLANGTRISNDPSPRSLFLLNIVNNDPRANVVYLARPCQLSYMDLASGICKPKHWSYARYSQEIVDSVNAALDNIKARTQAKNLELVGFSGGGAIVTLVAAKRDDVVNIRTIAGNLDLAAMDAYHKTKPLYESLDPLQIASKIAHIPQQHFVGTHDQVVPAFIAQNFAARANNPAKVEVIKISKATHTTGWGTKIY